MQTMWLSTWAKLSIAKTLKGTPWRIIRQNRGTVL